MRSAVPTLALCLLAGCSRPAAKLTPAPVVIVQAAEQAPAPTIDVPALLQEPTVRVTTATSGGSGTVLADRYGGLWVLTNHHVVHGACDEEGNWGQASVALLRPGDAEPVGTAAEVVHASERHDLALLRVLSRLFPAKGLK